MSSAIIRFCFINGELKPCDIKSSQTIKQIKKSLKEGDVLECYMNVLNDDHSLAQLAKVHAMIRDIAQSSGNSFILVKREIKIRCGFYIIDKAKEEGLLMSFADMSKEELGKAIEEAILIGDEFGINLH